MESYEFLLNAFKETLTIAEGVQSKVPEKSISQLINALANAALYQSHDKSIRIVVVGLLKDALRDARSDVQKDVIHALVKLEDYGSVGVMRGCKSAFAAQDWPFISKKIDGMKKGVEKGVVDLGKRVEEVEGKIRSLEGKVQTK
jgi:hypothetical protein